MRKWENSDAAWIKTIWRLLLGLFIYFYFILFVADIKGRCIHAGLYVPVQQQRHATSSGSAARGEEREDGDAQSQSWPETWNLGTKVVTDRAE